PLRVELMEGRLMLAASSLDASQPATDTAPPIGMWEQISLTGVQFTYQSQTTDGGYLDYDGSSAVSYGLFGGITRGTFRDQPIGSNTGWSTSIADTSAASFHELIPKISPIDGTGLQPVVIVSGSESGSVAVNMKPVVIGPSPSQPGPTAPA